MTPTTTSPRNARSTTTDGRDRIALGQMSNWINQDMVWHKNDQPAQTGDRAAGTAQRSQRFPQVIR